MPPPAAIRLFLIQLENNICYGSPETQGQEDAYKKKRFT